MEIKIKKLHPRAVVPTYATDGAACFDLCAIVSELPGESITVEPGFPVTFRTGLAFEIPPGFGLFVFSRSGHGFNKSVRLSNCVGVIDADYRGEVKVRLTADQGGRLDVRNGDRIAQAMVLPVPRVAFVEAEDLSDTARGSGGFGSTGA